MTAFYHSSIIGQSIHSRIILVGLSVGLWIFCCFPTQLQADNPPASPGSARISGGGISVGKSTKIKSIDGKMVLLARNQDLLSYQFELLPPPPGVDPAYHRSGFVHPLKTLSGHILTRIHPPDHYHHFGIWNPWTQVEVAGKTVDFWNIGGKEGTVRFAGFKKISEGSDFLGFSVLQEHVVFGENEIDNVVLNEMQTWRLHLPDQDEAIVPKYYTLDLAISYTCAVDQSIKILEHRYGGLGWRASEEWKKDGIDILTSEGKSRDEADGSLARWVISTGTWTDGSRGGILLMSHPKNFNHPEPLRVWPSGMYPGGDLFVNFCPVKNTVWLMTPGEEYRLRYRMVVFDGQMTPILADNFWQEFERMKK